MITAPGIYDIPSDAYHSDPVPGGSLSYSGSKKLLISPAHFRWNVDNGQPERSVFDLGKAAHAEVLGVGETVHVVDAKDWKTKAAQAERDAAYARGEAPILREQAVQVRAMGEALRRHPLASRLLARGESMYERTIVWRDPRTGIWLRMMTDAVRTVDSNGVRYVIDYKSAASIQTRDIESALFRFGYFGQGAWYLDGIHAMEQLGILPPATNVFVLIFQEKEGPYEVACVPLDPDDLAAGDIQNRDMRQLYRECTEAGQWPGPHPDFVNARMPAWAHGAVVDARYAREEARAAALAAAGEDPR